MAAKGVGSVARNGSQEIGGSMKKKRRVHISGTPIKIRRDSDPQRGLKARERRPKLS